MMLPDEAKEEYKTHSCENCQTFLQKLFASIDIQSFDCLVGCNGTQGMDDDWERFLEEWPYFEDDISCVNYDYLYSCKLLHHG